MLLSVKQLYAISVVAALAMAGSMAQAASAPSDSDAHLATAVTAALQGAMGKTAKDITPMVRQGVVTLTGWTQYPRDDAQARVLALTVPGVTQAYSQLHTWQATNPAQ